MTVPPPFLPGPVEPPATYVAGAWLALVLDDLVLLADVDADSRVLGSCWAAAQSGQGGYVLDAVLAQLTAPGPQAVSDFAAAFRGADGTRVVVAGSARASVGGTLVVAEGGTPADERFGGRAPVRLTAGAGGAAGDVTMLPLVRGIVRAGAIGAGVAAADMQGPPSPAADAAAPPVQPAPPPARPPAPEPDPVPVPRVSSDTMPPSSVYDSGLIESLPWRGAQDAPAVPSFSSPPASSEPAGPPGPAGSADPAAPSEPTEAPPANPSWSDPFGSPPDARAQNPWAPAPGSPPAWPEPPRAPFEPPPPAAPAPPVRQQAPASPWAPGGPAEAEDAPPAGSPESPGDPSVPVVHAVACPRGHLNPPYANHCRICNEAIAAQDGFAAPRPSLGVLKLSTGDTVPLDRDVVLGRAPFHADDSVASRPHLVQLASPGNDISRSHVRVSLENWFVQVTDLGSTNGTVVTLPDQAPVRLRPHDPFTILPGTTVNVADEITLRYEIS